MTRSSFEKSLAFAGIIYSFVTARALPLRVKL